MVNELELVVKRNLPKEIEILGETPPHFRLCFPSGK
jgi:hypothetical protein